MLPKKSLQVGQATLEGAQVLTVSVTCPLLGWLVSALFPMTLLAVKYGHPFPSAARSSRDNLHKGFPRYLEMKGRVTKR